AEEDAATREALILALASYIVVPNDRPQISRPYIRGLANMVRAHADQLAHRLKTATDDPASRRATQAALEQICSSLADLRQALLDVEPEAA
ncbi:MAG: hypothetical protein JWQ58_1101, partial [Reyranella sp.]|nr:hypothetical protein [Reyranella sp.]